MTKPSSNKNTILLAGILILVSGGVYLKIFWAGFVFDDYKQLVNNEWVTDTRYIPDILTSPTLSFQTSAVDAGITNNYYRPVMHLTYMAAYHLFGFNPTGYHLLNVLFHSINTVLVFLIASTILGLREAPNAPPAGPARPVQEGRSAAFPFIVALIFATHPVNSEVVSWIAAIPELSYTFFFLVSLFFYIRFGTTDARHRGYLNFRAKPPMRCLSSCMHLRYFPRKRRFCFPWQSLRWTTRSKNRYPPAKGTFRIW